MPFSVREQDLPRYHEDKNHWNEVYRGLILPAAKAAGLDCERDDEDSSSRLITENIWRKLEDADVVLCDLSSHNPNVYLELGWALRADKRFVLIKDDITHFNFDLNQFYTYQYSHLLQPLSLQTSVGDLAKVLAATLSDETRKYSIVHKLSLNIQALEAAKGGNIEVSLLKELLEEVRFSRRPERLSQGIRPRSGLLSFPSIRSQTELAHFLPGTTWRKANNVEHVIFGKNGKFYNNHAGHPSWRENTYRLEPELGVITATWSIDDLATACRFSEDFSEFVEMKNRSEGIWSVIALEPHTPTYGI